MIAFIRKVFMRICPASLARPATKVFYVIRLVWYRIFMLFFSKKMHSFCPCCGMKFRSFDAGGFRDNPKGVDTSRYKNETQRVLCPVCRSLPRHRIQALWFEKHKECLHDTDILYFSPGRSEVLWMKRNKVSYVTADLYSKSVDIRLDIQKTGLPDESYDLIVCNHVLEHVDDFRAAIKEMFRILRFGGSFLCSFPMDPKVDLLDEDPAVQSEEERIRRFGQKDHKRVFGMNADRFLTEAGFSVERIDGKDYPEAILPVVGPADYDMNLLFYCVKKKDGTV